MDMGLMTTISLFLMLAIFVIGTARNINLGILGFVASLILGYFLNGVSFGTILEGINTELLVILIGVTFFFNILRANGTLDLVVIGALKLIRGRIALIPWCMFLLSYVLAALGTQGTATIVIAAPIGMALANKYKFSQLMTSLMIAFGMFSGLYSPLNPTGASTTTVVQEYGVSYSALVTCGLMLIFTFGLSVVAFLVFGGGSLIKRGRVFIEDNDEIGGARREAKITSYQIVSIIMLALLVFFGVYMKLNMGFAAMLLGSILALKEPSKQEEYIKNIPWSIILMITGIVCYIETMVTVGVMDYLEALIADFNNPKLTILIASYIGALISAFCATLGTVAGIIPMVGAVLANPIINAPAAIACICISSTIVDVCPFSGTGAVLVASAQGEEKKTIYNKLLISMGVMMIAGPLLTWSILVLPF